MASDVVMPRLSDSMEEGTVLKWLIDEGGEVKRGEPLVEIETDKANMTYDSDRRRADRDRGPGGRHAPDRRGDRAHRRGGRGQGGAPGKAGRGDGKQAAAKPSPRAASPRGR